MPIAETKISSTPSHVQRKANHAFFSKESQRSFFSKSVENTGDFFTPASVQPKLKVGQPDDKYELEADSMADKVVQRLTDIQSSESSSAEGLGNVLQPKCTSCEEEEEIQLKEEDNLQENNLRSQGKILAPRGGILPSIQLQTDEELDRFDTLHPSRDSSSILDLINPSIMEGMQTYCSQNCPATASALSSYLRTGDITAAHCSPMMERGGGIGYTVPAADRSFRQWSGRRGAWRFIRRNTNRHGRFVVVEGDRVSPDPGFTRYHYFIILNIRGSRFVVDAFTHQVHEDINRYLERLGARRYSVYTGNFVTRPVLQHKLNIGSPKDKYEVEADAMADRVVNKLSDNQPISESNTSASSPQLQKKSSSSDDKAGVDIQEKLNLNAGSGNPLSPGIKDSIGSAFGADFNDVRVHTDSDAVKMNRQLNSQAFTHGNDIYFNEGKYSPETSSGKHLLAHELTHTVQQLPEKKLEPKLIQRQQALDDPGRFGAVHGNLFGTNPSATNQPWVEPTSSDQIFQEFDADFPRTAQQVVPVRTTEDEAETDALMADQRIRTAISEILTPVSEARLRDAVQIMDDSFFQDEEFRRAWLANQMIKYTDIENFEIEESDVRYKALQDRMFNDRDINERINNKIRLQSAFARGDDPSNREIFLNEGIPAARRQTTLIHEVIHLYAHPQYREWLDQSTAARYYNEGLTEHFARQVMNSAELTGRNAYRDNVAAVTRNILAFASESDVRKAFFQGEVWRLEHTSEEAKEAFGNQIGIQPDATRDEERAQSLTSAGIIQVVEENRHIRFMNLGISEANPKPEHQAFLQRLITDVIQQDPNLRLRFVGHTSTTGSIAFNRTLSRRRVNAFYQLARDAGIAESQLINADNPEFEGEISVTANDDSVMGRAMNRRVELYIVSPASTELEDNVFHLERLRGQGQQDDGFSLGHELKHVFKNSPNPEDLLPYISNGWNASEIMTQLGQHDILAGTDSDNSRCVQAVAMASYIPSGPDAVVRYLEIIVQEANLTRNMNQRRLKSIEVINFIKAKISSRTATFGDLSWAQEAVHDLFFDDVSGTDAREIINQISPSLDASRASQSLDIWTSSSSELMAAIQNIQPGEQYVVNHWAVLFDQSFENLRDQGIPTRSPMRVNNEGRLVSITELNPTSRPAHTAIDENRDKKSGHQLLIFMDSTRKIWFYEPELDVSGDHLFEVTNNPELFDRYFTEVVDIELYEYVQILGKITPVVVPTGTP